MMSKRDHREVKHLAVLDVDGVLLDSRDNMRAAWQSVCANVGITVPFDAYFALIGRPFADIMAALGLADIADRCETTFRAASAASLAKAPFFAGIPDALQQLDRGGIKLAILTSKDQERTALVLKRLPVKFVAVQTPTPLHSGKPHPDQLVHTAEIAGETLDDTCYIGDLEVDALTARSAGVDYLHADWGYGARPAGDYTIVERPGDLVQLLHPFDASR